MKRLFILEILSLIYRASGACSCVNSLATCTTVQKCENSKLDDCKDNLLRSVIDTEEKCLHLLTNSTTINGIEWKSYDNYDPCRTRECDNMQIVPYSANRTVYWKTCAAECECLQNPLNGKVTTTVDINLPRTATFSCYSGYILSGPSTITCNNNGNWSESPPTCIVDCRAPIAPADGYVNFTSTTLASQANFSCNAGYVLTGSPYTTCESNGLWSASQTACAINCSEPIPPENGSVNYTLTILNSKATYSCNEGFNISGSTNTTCEANGNWSDSQVVCLIRDCNAPTSPLNGSVYYNFTTFKSQANYICDEGFVIHGSAFYTTCGTDGNWSESGVVCIIKDCGAPTSPLNGSVIYNSTTFKSQANYSCDEGFDLDGSTNTTCEANGNWSGSQVKCLSKECYAPTPPLNGSVNYTSTTFRSLANYSCDEGFDLYGSTNATCGANGNWSDSEVVCSIKNCHAPTSPTNGFINYTSTTYNSKANYSCDEGYDLNGTTYTTCMANGTWSDLFPSCLIKDCLAPTSLFNGSVNYTSTTYNSQANYSCDQGFNLNGSTHTTCGANGNWSGPFPTCTIKDCQAPVPLANGFVNFSATTYNSQAIYSCNQGFNIIGSTQTTCGSNGNWSDLFPTCTIKDCRAPIPPVNGSVNFTSTTYNSQATYSCDQGFNINGSTNITCGANGNWSEPLPTCTIKDCHAPIPPVNGSVNFTSTTYNSLAIYSCDQGFKLDGIKETACGDNGKWTNTSLNCSLIDCKEPSQVINGEVDFNETTYGKQSVYSCHPGFDIFGPSTLTCKGNGLWGPFMPSCLDPGSKKKPLYIIPCNCCPNKTFTNMTLDEILDYLENATGIDTKNTSAALDKLRSRSDSRTSSAVIGTVAAILLSTLAGLIVCSDLIMICKKKHAKCTPE